MSTLRSRLVWLVPFGLLAVGVPLAWQGTAARDLLPPGLGGGGPGAGDDALAKVRAIGSAEAPAPSASAAAPSPSLRGLDLSKLAFDDEGVTAPLEGGRLARLSLDPAVQRAALDVLAANHVPEGAIVVADAESGRVLAYANHVESGPARDLCAEAGAPAASVFKIVTSAALVGRGKAGPDTRACYSGGEQRLYLRDLEPNPARDRWCTTLSGALGRSLNTVFARFADEKLDKRSLEETAKALGFGRAPAFDLPVAPSTLDVPDDRLGFARTAAGFWHSSLSPVHGAELAATFARGGEPVRLRLVDAVVTGKRAEPVPAGRSLPRAVDAETARAVARMMEHTVTEGTGHRAFHDRAGRPFLGDLPVAGKTGTLTDAKAQKYYSWFVGFAPSRPVAGVKPVAFAVLLANGPVWKVKANTVAREVLRTHFAGAGVKGVTAPSPPRVARR